MFALSRCQTGYGLITTRSVHFENSLLKLTSIVLYQDVVAKGQLILKGLFGFFNSSKKRTKSFCPSRLGQKFEFSSLFFGRIEDTQISFRDYLTFTKNLWLSYIIKCNYNQEDVGKGQLILKGNFGVFNSSKKRTWKFEFLP